MITYEVDGYFKTQLITHEKEFDIESLRYMYQEALNYIEYKHGSITEVADILCGMFGFKLTDTHDDPMYTIDTDTDLVIYHDR